MGFDAPRKTLDDIRRELDAEYPSLARTRAANGGERPFAERVAFDVDAEPYAGGESYTDTESYTDVESYTVVASPADDDGEAVVRWYRERRARRRRRGAIVLAGIIGCIGGQLMLLGVLAVMRSSPSLRREPTTSASVASDASVAPPARSGPPSVASPPLASQSVASPTVPPEAAAIVPEPSAAMASPVVTERATERAPELRPAVRRAPAVVSAPRVESTPRVPSPPRVQPAPRVPSAPRVQSAPSALPSERDARVTESDGWAKSQDQVRAALSEWLTASGLGGGANARDTLVILGADGRTAKTHVRVRSNGATVVREQRWTRGPNGWSLVDDKEAWRVDR